MNRDSTPPDPVAEVTHRMQEIRDSLDPHDGVACFNRMYLQVTELIGQNLIEGFFEDDAFVERLDVIFAGLYFQGVDSVGVDQKPNRSWKPLFDARSNRVVWPIQFALAGMNAHINHDLTLAVITTCQEFGKRRTVFPSMQTTNGSTSYSPRSNPKYDSRSRRNCCTSRRRTPRHSSTSWEIGASQQPET